MPRTPRLSVESLEARALMSTYSFEVYDPTPVPYGTSVSPFGTLRLKGAQHGDDARVWVENGQLHATFSHLVTVPSPDINTKPMHY